MHFLLGIMPGPSTPDQELSQELLRPKKNPSIQREHFVQNGHRPYLSRGYYSYYRNQPSEDKREYLTDPGSYWIVVRLRALN
jgi:hypothetical protein